MSILNNFWFRLLAGAIFFLILGTCIANAKPKPKKDKKKHHTYIVTPYHIFTNDKPGQKPIEIF